MSTLFGQKIQDTYPSILRVDNFTGASGTEEYVVDGLGNALPIIISTTKIRFQNSIDFKDTTDVSFSGTSVSFVGATMNFTNSVPNFQNATFDLSGATMDYSNTNTTGIIKSAAVQLPTGKAPEITDDIAFSAGTGMSISQDISTGIFTFNYTGSTGSTEASGNIIKVGTGTTTANTIYYWNGTNWQTPVNASNSYNKLLGIAKGTNPATDGMYISGIITGITSYSAGSLWLDETSNFTSTQPYTDGVAIRGVGHSLGSLGIVFQPDVWYEFNDNTNYLDTHLNDVLITNDGFALEY